MIIKEKCDICGRIERKIIKKGSEPQPIMYKNNGRSVCKRCEQKYHLLGGYSSRGYGYKYSTTPSVTVMDRTSTPTFGIEIEVAGNILNIDKIFKVTERPNNYSECSIGYDTSVNGAQFELSYAPGTYYWLLYESHLKQVCKLLQKDSWTQEKDTSAGMHIHVGNINLTAIKLGLEREASTEPAFWRIFEIIGERSLDNKYCRPVFTRQHHDAISRSRWGTMEFRIFSGTYDFDKIMMRIKFLRQIINNCSVEGVKWKNFSQDVKEWVFKLVENSNLEDFEKEQIKQLFNGEIEKTALEIPAYVSYWATIAEREYYGEEEDRENEEEEEEEFTVEDF